MLWFKGLDGFFGSVLQTPLSPSKSTVSTAWDVSLHVVSILNNAINKFPAFPCHLASFSSVLRLHLPREFFTENKNRLATLFHTLLTSTLLLCSTPSMCNSLNICRITCLILFTPQDSKHQEGKIWSTYSLYSQIRGLQHSLLLLISMHTVSVQRVVLQQNVHCSNVSLPLVCASYAQSSCFVHLCLPDSTLRNSGQLVFSKYLFHLVEKSMEWRLFFTL